MGNVDPPWNKLLCLSCAIAFVSLLILATCWGGFGAGSSNALAAIYAYLLLISVCCYQKSGVLRQTHCIGCCAICPDCLGFSNIFHLRNAFVALIVIAALSAIPGLVVGPILLSITEPQYHDHYEPVYDDYYTMDDGCVLQCNKWRPRKCPQCYTWATAGWSPEVPRACCANGNDATCSGDYDTTYGYHCPKECVNDCRASPKCMHECFTCGLLVDTSRHSFTCYEHQEDGNSTCKEMCDCLGGFAVGCDRPLPPMAHDPHYGSDDDGQNGIFKLFGTVALVSSVLNLCLCILACFAASAASGVIREQGGPQVGPAGPPPWVAPQHSNATVVGTPVMAPATAIAATPVRAPATPGATPEAKHEA